MKDLKVIMFLVLLGAVFFCGFLTQAVKPQKVDPSNGSIQMVQPCGWFWCANYDQQYAEHVNVPNSQANEQNGQANLYNAQATAIVNQTVQHNNDVALGGLPFWCGFLALALVAGAIAMKKG